MEDSERKMLGAACPGQAPDWHSYRGTSRTGTRQLDLTSPPTAKRLTQLADPHTFSPLSPRSLFLLRIPQLEIQ